MDVGNAELELTVRVTIDVSLILSPSAIEPSMPRTAGFQSGKAAASVNNPHTTSGLATIDLLTE